MDTFRLVVPLLAGLLVAVTAVLVLGAFRRQRTILTPAGARLAPSDMERLFAPLARVLAARRKGGRRRLEQELTWARSGWSPELFVLAPWIGLPLGMLAAGGTGAIAELDADMLVAMTLIGGVIGYFYPKARIGRVLKRRAAAIDEDVPAFIAQVGRVASAVDDHYQNFTAIYERVTAESLRAEARQTLLDELRTRRYGSPYASDLWTGFRAMMDRHQELARAEADFDDPDPLLEFATWCDNDELTVFLLDQRQRRLADYRIDAAGVDAYVARLRRRRIEAVRRSLPRMQSEALVFLVLFCLPMLFAVMMVPILASPSVLGLFLGGV